MGVTGWPTSLIRSKAYQAARAGNRCGTSLCGRLVGTCQSRHLSVSSGGLIKCDWNRELRDDKSWDWSRSVIIIDLNVFAHRVMYNPSIAEKLFYHEVWSLEQENMTTSARRIGIHARVRRRLPSTSLVSLTSSAKFGGVVHESRSSRMVMVFQ